MAFPYLIFVFAFYVSRSSSNQILRYYITGVLIFHFLLKIYDFNSYKEKVSRQQIVYEQKVTETMQNKVKMAAIFLQLPDSSHQSKKTYVTFPASFIFNSHENDRVIFWFFFYICWSYGAAGI